VKDSILIELRKYMREAGLTTLTIYDDGRDRNLILQSGNKEICLSEIQLRASDHPRWMEEKAIKDLAKFSPTETGK